MAGGLEDPSHWGESGLVATLTAGAMKLWDKVSADKKMEEIVRALNEIKVEIAVIKSRTDDVKKLREDFDQLRRDHDNLRTEVARHK